MIKPVTPNRPFLIALAMHFDDYDKLSQMAIFIMKNAEILIKDKYEGAVELYDFSVGQKFSGQGHGSTALKTFCRLADLYNVEAELYVEQDKDYQYPFPSLLEFYQRHGFIIQDQVSLEMLRKPGAQMFHYDGTPYLGRV